MEYNAYFGNLDKIMKQPVVVFSRRTDDGVCRLHFYDGRHSSVLDTTDQDCCTPAISPDGMFVAYSRYHSYGIEIVLLNIKTGHLNVITSGPFCDFLPTWSQDGKRLAFCRGPILDIEHANSIDLYGIDLETLVVRRLTDNNRFDAYPCFIDPDLLVYESGDKNGFFGIFTVPWNNSRETALIYEPHQLGIGIPHVHKRNIVAEQCDVANPDEFCLRKFLLDADISNDSQIIPLSLNKGGNPSPRFSHDGGHIVCYAWWEGRGQIVILDSTGCNQREINPEGMSFKLPRWSRNDRLICCEETVSQSLALVDTDTREIIIIPDSQGFRTQRFGELYNFDIA